MLNKPLTHFGHEVAAADDFDIGITDDGTGYVIEHLPSGQRMVLGPDGFETGTINTEELSVGDTAPDPAFNDNNIALSGEESRTKTFLAGVGENVGRLSSVNDLDAGAMTAYIRYITDLKIADSAATASAGISFTEPTNGTTFLDENVSTTSTSYVTLGSGWNALNQENISASDPFVAKLRIKTTDSTYAVSARHGNIIIGWGP
jgi:hypothetical protein